MKLKKMAPVVIALILGLAAAKLVLNSITRNKSTTTTVVKTVQIVVANNNLITGQAITADDLTMSTVNSAVPPPDSFVNIADLLGRVLTAPVSKGQSITVGLLAPKGASAGLASLVPSGMRALTINVDEANTLSNMLLPGCHVDIVGTIANGKESISRTLVKNVLIQAVGARLTSAPSPDGKDPGPFHTVTVIVSPRDGQLIELATISARIRLMLRPLGKTDDELADASDVTMAMLTGGKEQSTQAPIVEPRPQPSTQPSGSEMAVTEKTATQRRSVELISGTTSTKVEFEMPRPTNDSASTQDMAQPAVPSAHDDEHPEF